MAGRLQQEIKQRKPFSSREQEALLNILRTASDVEAVISRVLVPADLSLPQYNVLRILRGAGAEGLPCGEVCDRLLTRDPDVTRLMDRLERRKLVTRQRATHDRRVVMTRITEGGLQLLDQLDAPMKALDDTLLTPMTAGQLGQLIDLLELVRERIGAVLQTVPRCPTERIEGGDDAPPVHNVLKSKSRRAQR